MLSRPLWSGVLGPTMATLRGGDHGTERASLPLGVQGNLGEVCPYEGLTTGEELGPHVEAGWHQEARHREGKRCKPQGDSRLRHCRLLTRLAQDATVARRAGATIEGLNCGVNRRHTAGRHRPSVRPLASPGGLAGVPQLLESCRQLVRAYSAKPRGMAT